MDELLTVQQAMDALRCRKSTLYKLIGRRDLSIVKVGTSTRIPQRSISRFIERHTIPERSGT